MDDLALAAGASPEIGRLYRDAKAFSSEAPVLALINLRGLAVAFCACLDRESTEKTLSERIEDLRTAGLVKAPEYRHLKRLQLHGNKGAHPEEFESSTLDFPVLAAQAMESALALIEQVYDIRDGRVPNYDVAPVESGALRDMCVKAMLERDVEAMNQAGEFFKERADREPKINVALAQDGYPLSARHDIDQAVFWLRCAADGNHPKALYHYGLYLTEHHKVSKDQFLNGQTQIARAAELKNPDALDYVGNASLDGSGMFVKDEVYARSVFMDAARQGHPHALAQLGAMSATGRGGPKDLVAAALYTLEAARAGIPQAQFNLSILYHQGLGLPQSESEALKCLHEAAAQDHPGAVYNLAIAVEEGRVDGRHPREAISEFERVVGHPNYRARASLYAANLMVAEEHGMRELMQAAWHLQSCYSSIVSDGDPHELKQDCLASARRVVGRMRAHLNQPNSDQETNADAVFLCAFFDRDCVPVVDAEARRNELLAYIQANSRTVLEISRYLIQEACLKLKPSRGSTAMTHSSKSPLLASSAPKDVAKIGRNELCPCGSGRKFKKCPCPNASSAR